MPTYPDVPLAPGVPSVPRDPTVSTGPTQRPTPTQTTAGASGRASTWGIYDKNGGAPITVTSFVGIMAGQEYDVSTYPVEKGSFETYNKVQRPFTGTLRLSRDKDVSDRKRFLDDLDALCASVDMFTVVTPERTYSNVTFVSHDYDRTAERGAGMIMADVRFMEVRQNTRSIFSETRAPDVVAPVDGGHRQAREPTKEEAAKFSAYSAGVTP